METDKWVKWTLAAVRLCREGVVSDTHAYWRIIRIVYGASEDELNTDCLDAVMNSMNDEFRQGLQEWASRVLSLDPSDVMKGVSPAVAERSAKFARAIVSWSAGRPPSNSG